MSDVSEIVRTVTKPLNVQKAKDQAKVGRCNVKILIVAYAVFAVVVFLQFQGISLWIVGLVTFLGLSMIGLTNWLQGKRIYKAIYNQELDRLENLVQLAQEKQNNDNNVLGAIQALAASVDAKDHYTYGHSEKVATYATEIAQEIGYSGDNLDSIRIAALLHDIGKIGVSDQVLSKPGPLSRAEWKELHSHPELGVAILQNIDAIKDCLPGVLDHHERYDGGGYPMGLRGDNIPLDARILAVADTYDALTSERPYRRGKMTSEQALAELMRGAETQFDPRVVNVFVNLRMESKPAAVRSERNPTVKNDQLEVASMY